ncbi:hypothetical protein [Mesoplasma photuris]|uniref:hypothetical protein n=1 Tax=Mesoplasma photuris TaxID=217731 RepID=UPI0004E2057E|nr:hypothetical protein [Mesoplasma photuris]
MSYYYKHNVKFSHHGLQRIRERLNMKDVEEFKVKEEVLKHIKYSTRSFEVGNNEYIRASNTDVYFVVDKNSRLIITATKISAEKELSLLSRGGW